MFYNCCLWLQNVPAKRQASLLPSHQSARRRQLCLEREELLEPRQRRKAPQLHDPQQILSHRPLHCDGEQAPPPAEVRLEEGPTKRRWLVPGLLLCQPEHEFPTLIAETAAQLAGED